MKRYKPYPINFRFTELKLKEAYLLQYLISICNDTNHRLYFTSCNYTLYELEKIIGVLSTAQLKSALAGLREREYITKNHTPGKKSCIELTDKTKKLIFEK